jgi:hypothetical protein
MACERWQEAILDRLYDEIGPVEDRALEAHLADCTACRGTIAEMRRVRTILREHEPEVPRAPRVMVLGRTSGLRPALLAASLGAAALLAGAGAGAGYALGRQTAAPAPPVAVAASPTPVDEAATQALIRQEIDRRIAELAASRPSTEPQAAAAGVTKEDLQSALAKLERKLDGYRASDLNYMQAQIEASEDRTGSRIGQTNQALRYVALASNPNVSER